MDWWEQLIDSQLKCVIKHPWHQHPEELVALLKTWVCINLNQPWIEKVIDHEIIAKNLEAEFSIVFIHLLTNRRQSQLHDRHHPLPQNTVKVHIYSIILQQLAL